MVQLFRDNKVNHALTILIICFSFTVKAQNKHIQLIENEIIIDGTLIDWTKRPLLSHLTNPWKSNTKDHTIFDFSFSNTHFYFYFQTTDSTLIIPAIENEMSIDKSDRVELFFSAHKKIANYYCVEINPEGNILDYTAKPYRQINTEWDFQTLNIAVNKSRNKYIVEGSIKRIELSSFGINKKFFLGVFRADYFTLNQANWYTWAIPKSDTPDFHIHSAFKKIKIK